MSHNETHEVAPGASGQNVYTVPEFTDRGAHKDPASGHVNELEQSGSPREYSQNFARNGNGKHKAEKKPDVVVSRDYTKLLYGLNYDSARNKCTLTGNMEAALTAA